MRPGKVAQMSMRRSRWDFEDGEEDQGVVSQSGRARKVDWTSSMAAAICGGLGLVCGVWFILCGYRRRRRRRKLGWRYKNHGGWDLPLNLAKLQEFCALRVANVKEDRELPEYDRDRMRAASILDHL